MLPGDGLGIASAWMHLPWVYNISENALASISEHTLDGRGDSGCCQLCFGMTRRHERPKCDGEVIEDAGDRVNTDSNAAPALFAEAAKNDALNPHQAEDLAISQISDFHWNRQVDHRTGGWAVPDMQLSSNALDPLAHSWRIPMSFPATIQEGLVDSEPIVANAKPRPGMIASHFHFDVLSPGMVESIGQCLPANLVGLIARDGDSARDSFVTKHGGGPLF
jgi:hypothetical protein